MANQNQATELCGKPRQQADKLLNDARNAGDRYREGSALTDLGVVKLHEGESQQAIADLEEALVLARQLGDQSLERDVLANLGLALLADNQPERARSILEQQVNQAKNAGDLFQEKLALDNLGAVYVKLGEFSQAIIIYQRALALAQEVGDRQHQADLFWILAIQHAELGERDKALTVGQKAIKLYEEMGAPQVAGFENNLQKYSQGPEAQLLRNKEFGLPLGGYYTGPTASSMKTGKESGPKLLWMAFAAAKSMANFLGSGLKIVAPEIHDGRLDVCATCPNHTGVRCKLCGCFTSVKAWLPNEKCPIGKWLV